MTQEQIRGPYRRRQVSFKDLTEPRTPDENKVIRQLLCDAVYAGEIDGVDTRTIAAQFDCSLILARTTLRAIVLGISGDPRFTRDIYRGSGVHIGDGRTFQCELLTHDELCKRYPTLNKSKERFIKEQYVWFLSE